MECAVCGKRGDGETIRRCSNCKAIRYCSRDCQERHWPRHKVTCRTGQTAGTSKEQANLGSHKARRATEQTAERKRWDRFFATLYKDPWQQARSRATAAFPGNRVSDTLGDLALTSVKMITHTQPIMLHPLPFMARPFVPMATVAVRMIRAVSQVVMVLKLVVPIIFPSRNVWVVKDINGSVTHLVLSIPQSSPPHFRCQNLEEGHFLCVKHASVFWLNDVMHFILVNDVKAVRWLRD